MSITQLLPSHIARMVTTGLVLLAGIAAVMLSPPSAGAAKTVNPCSLLTDAQLQPILLGKVVKTTKAGNMCTFATANVNGEAGNFAEVFTASSYNTAKFRAAYLTTTGRREGYTPITGIGSLAVLRRPTNEVDFLKGSTQVTLILDVRNSSGINSPMAPATLESLARKAAARDK